MTLGNPEYADFSTDSDYSSMSSSYMPDLSSEQLVYEDQKERLVQLILAMVVQAPSWDGEPAHVAPETADAAINFLRCLLPNRELPKVAPDGEGDILFVWEPPVGNCIVTVQGKLLHMVDCPGTPNVAHVDDEEFTGVRIPPSILHAIPMM